MLADSYALCACKSSQLFDLLDGLTLALERWYPIQADVSVWDTGRRNGLRAGAQVAANNKGIQLVQELIQEYSLKVVQAYMHYIQARRDCSLDLQQLLLHQPQF